MARSTFKVLFYVNGSKEKNIVPIMGRVTINGTVALQRNRREERMGMVTKAHEAATPNTPSGTEQSEFFNGSLGLLNGSGSSYNAADAEANQEMADILRRKKKRKRGFRL